MVYTSKMRNENCKDQDVSWAQWLKPVTLATQEAEVRRIRVQGQPKQKVNKTSPQSIKS
jgi:hypothetical protein